jgi:phenylacetate-coenzyme A ligase PaaK-like adenylate-forming protein
MKKINKWDIAKRLADTAGTKAYEAEDEKNRRIYAGSEELKKEWERELEDRFVIKIQETGELLDYQGIHTLPELKSFISSLLAKQQAIMIEELDNLWVNNHETSEKFELAFGKYLDNKLEK